jgi:DNA mismatch repair protein MutL
MGKIQELPPDLINKIAAGEVIESSHSVVKELTENSLDAEARNIVIETENGGLSKIVVADDGVGFLPEDLEIAIHRHTTSKIRNLDDLEKILTFGFRGEALSSIASISKLKITSGVNENEPSLELSTETGKIVSKKFGTGRKGTVIEVQDLFLNTPVRRKFLKSERSEDKKIKDRIIITALSRPDVNIKYIQNGKISLDLYSQNRRERIVSIFGDNMDRNLLEVNLERRGITANGFISSPEFFKSNRTGQFFYINGRPVELKYGSQLIRKCYDELIPYGSHPWCFLFFQIDPRYIDVNVHPAKKEIRFLDDEGFQAFFLQLINQELRSKTPVSFLELKRRMSQPVSTSNPNISPRIDKVLSPTVFSTKSSMGTFQQIMQEVYKDPPRQAGYNLENVGAGNRMEDLTSNPIKSREFVPKKHFGILFETFILAEAEDGLYIIDQHTAHERIRYEEVLNYLKKNQGKTQQLLAPIRLDFSIQEAEEILEKREDFKKLGIVLDDLGGGSIAVRETPPFLEPGTEREVVSDLLNRSLDSQVTEKDLYDLIAKCVACRSAIKKGDHLSDAILGELLNRLSYCENPSRCPHGRPTLIKLTRFDLEKMFHRR